MRAPTKLKPQARTYPAPKETPCKSVPQPSTLLNNNNNQNTNILSRPESHPRDAVLRGIDSNFDPITGDSFRQDLPLDLKTVCLLANLN
jgi:hypothetical protein